MHKSIPFPAFVATWQGTARMGRDAESQTLRYEIKDTGAILYTDSQGDFPLRSEILISTEDILFCSTWEASAPDIKSKILFMALDSNRIYSFYIVSSGGMDFFISATLLKRTKPIASEYVVTQDNTCELWKFNKNTSDWETGVNGLLQQKECVYAYSNIKFGDKIKDDVKATIHLELSCEEYLLEKVNAKDVFGSTVYLGQQVQKKQLCAQTWIRKFKHSDAEAL